MFPKAFSQGDKCRVQSRKGCNPEILSGTRGTEVFQELLSSTPQQKVLPIPSLTARNYTSVQHPRWQPLLRTLPWHGCSSTTELLWAQGLLGLLCNNITSAHAHTCLWSSLLKNSKKEMPGSWLPSGFKLNLLPHFGRGTMSGATGNHLIW